MPDGFNALKKRILEEYEQAYKEISAKAQDFADKSRIRELEMRAKLKDGKITQAQFDSWMKGQVFQGAQWEDRKKQMAATLRHADEVAVKMANGERFQQFAYGHNRIAYEITKDAGVMINFTQYDADTVRRLIKDRPDLLPPRKLAGRDKAYSYYNRMMDRIATQGILLGESVRKIAQRIAKETGESAAGAALRNARTMQTGAQNAGRLEGMHRAQDMGINVKKKWLATLDGRTRDSHRDLDGQIADVDEAFISPLGEIRFPGDPEAAPGDVWNCRCTLVSVYPDYAALGEHKRYDNEEREIIDDMTYREWEAMKRGEEAEPIDIPEPTSRTTVDGTDISTTWERRPDQFDFEINDVIDAQGFDGNPRVVDADEFDMAVQESGFIALRTYSAPDQETLDAYREQLYNGDWYVDCSTGGALFGQGMYSVSKDGTEITSSMEKAIEGYKKGSEHVAVETFTLVPGAKVADYETIEDIVIREAEENGLAKREDVGVRAAKMGYDAVKVPIRPGYDYTIILNRTKVIFRRS